MVKTYVFEEYAKHHNFSLKDIHKRMLSPEEKRELAVIVHDFMFDISPKYDVLDLWHAKVAINMKKFFDTGVFQWWVYAQNEMDKFISIARAESGLHHKV